MPDNWWVRTGKRLFDVAVVISSFPIWGFVLAIGLVAVWLSSGRPLFFIQYRVGFESKHFKMPKLRTMHVHAGPANSGLFAEWTVRNDARVTPVGRWLRRWRCDELPQMICVLRGEMSLVGPRPEMPSVVDALSRTLPGYSDRHLVKPGLTGLCQVSSVYYAFDTLDGLRARLRADLQYIDNLCMVLDLKVALRTLRVLATGMGVV